MTTEQHVTPPSTLDPTDWQELRTQGHRMLDDIFNYLENLRERPVWQPIPQTVRARFQAPLPRKPNELADVHESFLQDILPYGVGNSHPGFMGWVQGGGNPVGMLAEMLAAGMNPNVGGRNQIPVEVERQVTQWVREFFNFPETATGLFVTGTSMANLMALWVARTLTLGAEVRQNGLADADKRLVAYTSAGAHGCVAQAVDLAGLGRKSLRVIPMNADFQMDVAKLREAIAADRAAGLHPFFIAATAGSVDVGAIDPLQEIADVAAEEKLWYHVDGAFGALGMLSPRIAPKLAGLERADSIAFDFHKWGQVPYDAGFIIVRDGEAHQNAFASPVNYLRREERGLAGGSPWPCDFGPDLSRGFRALKTWYTLQVYGTEKLGEVIAGTCDIAQYLKDKIDANPALERLAPVALNIVCFRYRCGELQSNDTSIDAEKIDRINADIAVSLQESGVAAPSTTLISGRLAIRAAIVNHRTSKADIDALIEATLSIGAAICKVQ